MTITVLVLAAGVGEHAAEIREAAGVGLECLELELDAKLNAKARPDVDVASPRSHGRIHVISTREDATMLREVVQVIARDAQGLHPRPHPAVPHTAIT
jgi:acetate kinase